MARPKPLPPPMAKCPLCDHQVEAVKLDLHERGHITVKTDTRDGGRDTPFRDRGQLRWHTVVYCLTDSVDGRGVDGTIFFPRAIVKTIESLPVSAQIHYLPETYVGSEFMKGLRVLLMVAHWPA